MLIYPAPVQGAAAVPALVRALAQASARAECDVLILTRGGGSLEDLWAFNDEQLARAIHACAVPVVSGVGHEVDFTIADLVADARAPTPSAAAELVAPDRHACLEALSRTAQRLALAVRRELRVLTSRLEATERRLRLTHPGVRLAQQIQRLDDLSQRLAGAMRGGVQQDSVRLADLGTRLAHCSPRHAVQEYGARAAGLRARLAHAGAASLTRVAQRLALAQRALHTLSPLATLSRGFAIITSADGIVTDAAAIAPGTPIEAQLARGRLTAQVTGSKS